MSRRSTLFVSLFLVAAMAGSVEARRYSSRYGYGGGGGGGTVFGSSATGMGNLIRAEGAYNQQTAQAMIALEQAKSQELANRLKAAQTYYQLRRLNEAEHAELERKRAAAYGPLPTPTVHRLTTSQLDPVTGAITWPAVLHAQEFESQRASLERLFAARAIDPSKVTNTEVEHVVEQAQEKLDTQHDVLSTSDFFVARHFLERLASESRTIVPGP